MWGEKKERVYGLRLVGIDRGLRIRVTQVIHRIRSMLMTEEAVKSWEFSSRCQMVASYLWNGKSVALSKEQLAEYGVTVHQVITELAYWLKAEESEACWEAEVLYQGSRRRCTWIVYCTKQGDKYVFKAKVKA
jgi:hypothetical protein